MKKYRYINLILIFILGLIVNYSISKFIIGKYFYIKIFVISIFIFILIYKLISKENIDCLNRYSRNLKLLIIIICLTISVIVSYFMPLHETVNNSITKLTFTATGNKNQNSKASEVWIRGLQINEINIPLNSLIGEGGWQLKGESIVSYKNQPVSFSINLKTDDNVKINFLSHAWSGIVKVNYQGQERITDLYSSNEDLTTVSFNHKSIISIHKIADYFFWVITIFMISISISLFMIEYYLSENNSFIKSIFFYCMPCLLVFLLYWLSFYPALMSADSFDQWTQMVNFKFSDHHPVFHTLSNWLITRVWFSPASIALLQILYTSVIFGYGMTVLERSKIQKNKILIISSIFAVLPINGMISISLWKDVPYSVSLLWLTIIMYKIIEDKSWLDLKKNRVILVIVLVIIVLLRHNGILSSVFSIFSIFMYKRCKRVEIFKLGVISLLIILLFKGPIFYLLKVTPVDEALKLYTPIQQVGAIVSENDDISESDIDILDKIMPYELWKKSYMKYSGNTIIYNPNFNMQVFADNKKDFQRLWLKLLITHPKDAIKNSFTMTSIVWQINQPLDGYTYTTQKGVDPNNFGIRTVSKIPKLNTVIINLIKYTESTKYNWLYCRPALSMYLILLFGVIYAKRKGAHSLIILVPILCNIAGVIIVNPAQDVRYIYSNFLILPFIFLLGIQKKAIITKKNIIKKNE